jgi:hypothetical protein
LRIQIDRASSSVRWPSARETLRGKLQMCWLISDDLKGRRRRTLTCDPNLLRKPCQLSRLWNINY